MTEEISLREYIESRLDQLDRRYDERTRAAEVAVAAALQAQKEAVLKQEIASDKRYDGLNELRGVVTDQQANFIQRLEALALIKALDDKQIAWQLSVTKDLASLRESRSETTGKAFGANQLWLYIVGGAGMASIVFGLYHAITGK